MTKRLFWNKKHLLHKTTIKSLIENIVTCFQLNTINQYQFIYNKTRFYWYVIEPKLIHLDSYYICFIFKANIVTWTCFAKFQNPLAVHIETKNSSTGLQYTPKTIAWQKKQTNHPQSDKILFQNNLKTRSKFLIMLS